MGNSDRAKLKKKRQGYCSLLFLLANMWMILILIHYLLANTPSKFQNMSSHILNFPH